MCCCVCRVSPSGFRKRKIYLCRYKNGLFNSPSEMRGKNYFKLTTKKYSRSFVNKLILRDELSKEFLNLFALIGC